MTTKERILKHFDIEFTDARETPDTFAFTIDPEDELDDVVELIADDGDSSARIAMTEGEYAEFLEAAVKVGREIGIHVDEKFGVSEVQSCTDASDQGSGV